MMMHGSGNSEIYLMSLTRRSLYLVAALVGISHAVLISNFWGFFVPRNPINEWLLDLLARHGHETAYRLAIYTHDLIFNFLLALPFAFLVATLKPRYSWVYLWISFSASTLLLEWHLLTDPEWLMSVLRMWSFYAGTAVMLVSLPLAFSAVVTHQRRRATE